MKNGYKLMVALFSIAILLGKTGTAISSTVCEYDTNVDNYLMDSPSTRFENKNICFSNEYKILEKRQAQFSSEKLKIGAGLSRVVGLGLSGGGIKSSAFQLGLLAGLHESKNANSQPLLNEIDYISSVSGGSWANGAYMAANEDDETFFKCLTETVYLEKGSACKERDYGKLLPDSQSKVFGTQDWQAQIIDNFLQGKDVKLSALRDHVQIGGSRPLPIFMTTHSNTIIGKKDIKNFPFEITPFHMGTIIDCNSGSGYCGFSRRYFRPLHWNNSPEKGFFLSLQRDSAPSIAVQKYSSRSSSDFTLSNAMWASGGLIAKVLSLHLNISQQGKQIHGIRNKYVLSDGGKSDNLGLIPLVERGANLIILSQIASDKKQSYGDLVRANKQIKKLFGSSIDMDRLLPQSESKKETNEIVTKSCVFGKAGEVSEIWLIKPSVTNVSSFYDYLKSKKPEIYNYLQEHESDQSNLQRFPQNDTIKLRYPKIIMHAYYLLGKYIAESNLQSPINAWLGNNTACH